MDNRKWEKQSVRARMTWIRRAGLIFAGILAFLFVVGLLLWLRPKTSALEKRNLAEFPTFSISGVMDGSWFSDLTTWYSDTYPLRQPMIRAYQAVEGIYGVHSSGALYGTANTVADEIPEISEVEAAPILTAAATPSPTPTETTPDGTIYDTPEVAGTIYTVGDRGFELYYFVQSYADTYASMLNTVASWVPQGVTVYDMVIPTSYGVNLSREVQEELSSCYQGDGIDYIYSRMSDAVHTIPIYETLVEHNAEYEYFRTDHHWTALGAYYAYREFCKVRGFTPHELTDYTKLTFDGFLGTYYVYSNQSPAMAANPDYVDAYVPIATNDLTYIGHDGATWYADIISDASIYDAENKYLTFIAGDEPFSEIHNPDLPDGDSCVVLKESFGNCFVPFLVDHYKDVYVVDYRYYSGDLSTFCLENGIEDVIFLTNAEAVTEERANMMLALFSDQSSQVLSSDGTLPEQTAEEDTLEETSNIEQ